MEKFFGKLTHKILEMIRKSKNQKVKQNQMKLSEFFRNSPLAGVNISRDKSGTRNNRAVE